MLSKTSKSPKKISSSTSLIRDKKKKFRIICSLCNQKNQQKILQQIIDKSILKTYCYSKNEFYSLYTKDLLISIYSTKFRQTYCLKDLNQINNCEEDQKEYMKYFVQKSINSNKQINQLVENNKYWKYIPRIFMVKTDYIIKKHHQQKKNLEYYKLKQHLKSMEDQKSLKIQNKKIYIFQSSKLLKTIDLQSKIQNKINENSESLSAIQLKQKLIKLLQQQTQNNQILQNNFEKNFPRKQISKSQYFQTRNRVKKNCLMTPSNVCFKKKKNIKGFFSPKNSSPKIQIITKNNSKRISMENIPIKYLKSEISFQQELKKRKRKSQQILPKSSCKIQGKRKNKMIKQQWKKVVKQLVISTETSISRLKKKRVVSPTCSIKLQKSQKNKHNRIISQQLQQKKQKNGKKQKLKITINENNIFNIVLQQKQKIQKKKICNPFKKIIKK